MKRLGLAVLLLCATASAQVNPVAQTFPRAGSTLSNDVAVWVHPTDVTRSQVLSTNDQGGLLGYALDGTALWNGALGLTRAVDVRYGVPLDRVKTDVIVSVDLSGGFRFLAPDPDGGLPGLIDDGLGSSNLVPSAASLYFNPRRQQLSLLVGSGAGQLKQYDVYDNDAGQLHASQTRALSFGKSIEGIAVDDRTGVAYLTLASAGLYRLAADADGGDTAFEVDSVDAGHLFTAAGLGLQLGPGNSGELIVASSMSPTFSVYSVTPPWPYLGSFTLVSDGGVGGVIRSTAVETVPLSLGAPFTSGLLVAADPANLTNKLTRWSDVAGSQTPALAITPTSDPRTSYGLSGAGGGGGGTDAGLTCPIILADGGVADGGSLVDAGSADGGCPTKKPGGGGVFMPGGGGFPDEPKSGCGCGETTMIFPLAALAWMLGSLRRRRSSKA